MVNLLSVLGRTRKLGVCQVSACFAGCIQQGNATSVVVVIMDDSSYPMKNIVAKAGTECFCLLE